jgi:hypothetical protein
MRTPQYLALSISEGSNKFTVAEVSYPCNRLWRPINSSAQRKYYPWYGLYNSSLEIRKYSCRDHQHNENIILGMGGITPV